MIRSVSKYPSLVSDQHALEAAEQALKTAILGTGGDALQNLNGLIKADSSRLSPIAMRDLTMSIDGTLSSRYGHDLLVQAMTDRDKGLDPSGFVTVAQSFFQEREGRAQLFKERDRGTSWSPRSAIPRSLSVAFRVRCSDEAVLRWSCRAGRPPAGSPAEPGPGP